DYTSKDERYDVIFDVTGKASFSGCLRILKEGGVYVMGNLGVVRVLRGRWATLRGTKKVIAGYTQYRVQDIEHVKELIEAGKIRSVIDRRYPLEQVVEAHRYVETGEKMGNVVLTMS
ncbi:MAG TPA: zinc-binding dehydrogenase, partial [Nitrososphaerales archaeon]|nr:zinc-binding dehydrogenase [Nitrososphaerales archaeon]